AGGDALRHRGQSASAGRIPLAPDSRLLPLDRALVERGDHRVGRRARHFDEGEAVGDLNSPDVAAADARFIGDGPNEVLWSDPGTSAGADVEAGYVRVGASASTL